MNADNRYALVRQGHVENVVRWDGTAGETWEGAEPQPDDWFPWSKSHGKGVAVVRVTDDAAGPGWTYVNGAFVPPSEPEQPPQRPPASVTMVQARLALLAAGKLDEVAAAIATMPSPHKEAAQIEWEFRPTVDRNSPFVQQLAGALGLDETALDALFTHAATL